MFVYDGVMILAMISTDTALQKEIWGEALSRNNNNNNSNIIPHKVIIAIF